MKEIKLDIGCGLKKRAGFIGIDKHHLPRVDIVSDLEKAKLPFPTNSVDKVVASHIFEHIRNYAPLVEELWRVMKPGAVLHVKVPNYKSENTHTDPTNARMFTLKSFDFFDKNKQSFKEYGWRTTHARFNIIDRKETKTELSFDLQASKNRILMVGPPSSIHTQRLYNSLNEYGYRIDVAARRLKGIATISLGDFADKEKSISEMPNVIRDLLKEERYDVVHAHYGTRYGHVLTAVPSGVKRVLSVWGEDVLDEALHSVHLRERLLQGINSSDYIITTSMHMKETMMNDYGISESKFWIIPLGHGPIFKDKAVGEDFYTKIGLSYNIPIITSARVCRPQNNIDRIIEAFIKTDLNVQLIVLTGNLSDLNYVHMLKEKSAHDKRVIYLNTLNEKDLSMVYNISEAILSIPYIDQLSTTILEALACGTPVICSNISVYHERIIQEKNGLFINSDDAEQLINALKYFSDKTRKYTMSAYAKESVRNDSWEENIKTLLRLYDNPQHNK